MKKILSLLLVVVIALTACVSLTGEGNAISEFEKKFNEQANNYTYTIDSDSFTATIKYDAEAKQYNYSEEYKEDYNGSVTTLEYTINENDEVSNYKYTEDGVDYSSDVTFESLVEAQYAYNYSQITSEYTQEVVSYVKETISGFYDKTVEDNEDNYTVSVPLDTGGSCTHIIYKDYSKLYNECTTPDGDYTEQLVFE